MLRLQSGPQLRDLYLRVLGMDFFKSTRYHPFEAETFKRRKGISFRVVADDLEHLYIFEIERSMLGQDIDSSEIADSNFGLDHVVRVLKAWDIEKADYLNQLPRWRSRF